MAPPLELLSVPSHIRRIGTTRYTRKVVSRNSRKLLPAPTADGFAEMRSTSILESAKREGHALRWGGTPFLGS